MRANHNIKILLWTLLSFGFLASDANPSLAQPGTPQVDAPDLLARFATRTVGDVAELRSIRLRTSVSSRMGGQTVTMDQRIEMVLPDRVRRTMLVADNEQAIVINAGRGFMASGELSLPLPEGRLIEAVRQLSRDLLILAASVGSPDLRVTAGPTDERDGLPCTMLDVTIDGTMSRLCLHDDGRAISQSFESSHPMSGARGTIEILFSDHRDAGGVFYPYRHAVTFNGEELVTVVVQSLEVNPDLPDSLFEMSPAE